MKNQKRRKQLENYLLLSFHKFIFTNNNNNNNNKVEGKVFPLQARLWPKGWVEV